MKKGKRRHGNSVLRVFIVGLSFLFDIALLLALALKLSDAYSWISIALTVLSLVVALRLCAENTSADFKLPWVIILLATPVAGIILYFVFWHDGPTGFMRKRFAKIDGALFPLYPDNAEADEALKGEKISVYNQSQYIKKGGHYPVYRHTDVTYYADGAAGFAAQKEDLKKARKFIFLEYHAIEDSECLAELKEILAERAQSGVEVRVLYDDIGSAGFINTGFIRRMKQQHIECRVFNPMIPLLSAFMNHRDHRKITVIDGEIGFTGGYNLADEYFHITEPYGFWKDAGVRLEGDAVASLTLQFLQMWNAVKYSDGSFEAYLPPPKLSGKADGFVQPYADSPLDNEQLGENIYMNILKNAERYAYFITPYLIVGDELKRELILAAKRGVDVRIVTPGVPDKKIVYRATRSYYGALAEAGVRIFEFTPGFCHAKNCVSDDEVATCGTINLDFRSLYLHFENGVFLYRGAAVKAIKEDFDNTFPLCDEVTERYAGKKSKPLLLGQCLLRLFSPLF